MFICCITAYVICWILLLAHASSVF
jgi:hypothetical protein